MTEIARGFKPELSVVHTTTPSVYDDIRRDEMLKDMGSTTVLVAAHASTLPQETMQISPKIGRIARWQFNNISIDN